MKAELLVLVEKIARDAFGDGARRAHEQERADYDMEKPATTWEEAENATVRAAVAAAAEEFGESCKWCGAMTLRAYSDYPTCDDCAAKQEARRQARTAETS